MGRKLPLGQAPWSATIDPVTDAPRVDTAEGENDSYEIAPTESPAMPKMDEDRALSVARDAFRESTTYFDSNIRADVERDIGQWQSNHARTSKYASPSYGGRSRLFRPMTRASIQRDEAKAAQAFFSSLDILNVEPDDRDDDYQVAAAKFFKSLLQQRLTAPSTSRDKQGVDWYLTVLGAYQDARVTGVAISKQYWKFDDKRGIDRPCVDLVPIENFRFDPACDWRRPAQTSPYLIQLVPMYLRDVMERINSGRWRNIPEGQVRSAAKRVSDSIRLQREGNRTDSTQATYSIGEFTTVWVHENIVDIDGADWHYYTLGTDLLLSQPIPVTENYMHGRPYVVGFSTIESHKPYPSSAPRLTRDLQREINDLANQRLDNISFVLNKRYFVRRDRQVDTASITRNQPASVTLMSDVDKDVRVVDTPDVTSSSYQEYDRLSVEFDSLAGTFNQSSIQSNRNLNETVGGIKLIDANAQLLSNYPLTTFVQTWVEPVLQQIVEMERVYESDEQFVLAALQASGADPQLMDMDIWQQPLMLTVNVGISTTHAADKINAIFVALSSLQAMVADGALEQRGLDFSELTKEVFGMMGYRDGSRFFRWDEQDPMVMQLQAQVEALQQQLSSKHPPELMEANIKKITAQTVSESLKAMYSAMQAGQVVASVPSVAPIADQMLADSGFKPQGGIDPNIPAPAVRDPALTQGDIYDPRTGVGFMPGGGQAVPAEIPQHGNAHSAPPGPPNTSPMLPTPPAKPASPGEGLDTGIETPTPKDNKR